MQSYRCYHTLCSALLALAPLSPVMANPPIPASQFLQNMGASPNTNSIYNFLEIYKQRFTACQEADAYLQALELLYKNGDDGFVRTRLADLNNCTNLSVNQKNKVLRLSQPIDSGKTVIRQANADQTNTKAMQPPVGDSHEKSDSGSNTRIETLNTAANKGDSAAPSEEPPKKSKKPANPHESTAIARIKPSTPRRPSQTAAKTADSKYKPEHPASALTAAPTNDLYADASTPETTPLPPINRPGRSSLGTSQALLPSSPRPSAEEEDNLLKIGLKSNNDWRNGDKGTSRLWRSRNNVILTNGPWSFNGGVIYLDSGRYAGNPTVGSVPINPPSSQLITHATVFEPKISYTGANTDITLGTTPLGGEASPLPTFKWAWHEKRGGLSLFHESVTDSLLSSVGFKDIYGSETMGRVIKTGISVNWNDEFSDNWFYGGGITGAYLYGKNVKENEAVKIESYLGKTIDDISVGLYASFDHFTRDLNHFTFGHGGYYSPQAAATLALFASAKQTLDNTTYKVDASLGLTYESTKDSQMYYFDNTGNTGIYKGEHKLKIPVNVGFNIQRKIDTNLFLNLDGRVLNSRSYTEGKFMINLDYRF